MIKRVSALAVLLGFVLTAHSLLLAWVPQAPIGQWAAIQTDPEGPPVTLSQSRDGAAAVLLANGAVLVTGGTDDSGTVLASTELFANGTFSAGMSMLEARSGHTVTALPDGRVVVAGGVTAGGAALDTIEVYSPDTGEWTAAGPLLTPRARHTTTLLKDGRLVVAGGENGTGPVDGLEVYDTNAEAVVAAGSLTSARAGHAAALLANGHVAIFGGSNGTNPLASVDILDADGYLLSVGPVMPGPRAGLSAVSLLDGRVLIAGGHDGDTDLDTVLMFDGTAFTNAGTLSVARRDTQALLLPHNNHVLIFGGRQSGARVLAAEMYRPWAGGFEPTGQPLSARADAALSALANDGVLLVAGGDGAASAEVYGFATLKTDDTDYSPGETVTMTGSGWQPGETVTLTLVESPKVHEDRTFTAVADGNGQIVNTEFVPELHHLGMRFYLTAVGGASQAQMTFTDAATLYWRGCTNTSWTTITNWRTSSGSNCSSNAATNFPGALSNDNAHIENVGNQPVINTALPFSLSLLTLPASTTLTVAASGSITLQNDTTVFGTLNQTGGTITVASGKKITTDGAGGISQSGGTMTVPLLENKSGRTFTQSGASSLVALNNGWKNEGTFTSTGGKVRLDSGATWQSPSTAANQFFDIEFDAAVTLNAQTISVSGSWQNDIAGLNLTGNDTLVIFNGGGAQQITGSQDTTFRRMTVNKSAGSLTLTTNTTVAATLTFTSGNLTTGSNTLTSGTTPTTGTVLASAATGWVVGNLKRFVNNTAASSTDTYQVGTASFYAPLTITPLGNFSSTTGASAITVGAVAGEHASVSTSGINSARNVNNYWSVVATGPGSVAAAGYKAKGEFVAGNVDAGADTSTFNVAKFLSASWVTLTSPARTGSSTEGSRVAGALLTASFGDFVIGAPAGGSTTTSVVTSGSPTVYGTSATFTATVTNGGAPVVSEGTVRFYDGGTCGTPGPQIGTDQSVDSNGQAQVSAAKLSVLGSPHTILACFIATANFAASSGTVSHSTTAKELTISGVTASNKVYDGNNTASLDVDIAALVGVESGDTVNLVSGSAAGAFADANVGTGKTVTITGFAITGAHSGNYSLTQPSATADITPAASATTVTCPAGPYTYTGLAQTPCSVSVTGAGGLALTPAPDYTDNVNAGLVTASYTYAGDANHTGSSDSDTFTIDPAPTTTTVTCPAGPYTYTGSAQTPCSATVTGAGGLSLTPTPDYSDNVNAGLATASYTHPTGGNYLTSTDSDTFTIDPAPTTTTVTCPAGPYTYMGSAIEPCSATVTGAGGLNETPTPDYTDNVNAGLATASYTYPAGGNYLTSTDSDTFTIDAAPTTTTVTCPAGPYTYTGSAQTPCSATVTGSGGLSLTPTPDYSDNVNAGLATASYTYVASGNYAGSTDSDTFTIDPAPTTTTVTCPAGPYTYTGAAQTPCSATVTGAGGLSLTPTPDYSDNVNAGLATASYTHAAGGNYQGSTDSDTFTIDPAPTTTTVTCPAGPYTYTGSAQTPCSATVTGAGGLSLTPTPDYSDNVNAGLATASYTHPTGGNYLTSTDSDTFTIGQASSTTVVTCPVSVPHTGSAQTPCSASVTGAGGLNLTPTPTYVNNTNAGTATASYTFAGDPNHTGSSDSTDFEITSAGYCFTGFLAPIGGSIEAGNGGTYADPVKAFKLGSTIPVKFLIQAASGSSCGAIVTTGIHTLQAIKYSNAIDSDPAIDATPTDAATTGNLFRLTGTEWHFNLSTKNSGFSVGTWLLRATLADGSVKTVWITIKK